MPLEFNHPRVAWFHAVNPSMSGLLGSYYVALNSFAAPQRVGFRWSAHVAGVADAAQVLSVRAPPTVRRTAGGSTSSVTPEQSADGHLLLPLMTGPGYDTITYPSERGGVEYRIWYLTGQIRSRTDGGMSADNTASGEVIYRLTYARGGRLSLGHGTCRTHTSVEVRGRDGRRVSVELQATRYYGLIEFEGEIQPHDAPGAYRFVRLKDVEFPVPESGQDTSELEVQRIRPTPGGLVYDTDGPGHWFAYGQDRGEAEEYRATFVQRLVVGERPDFSVNAKHILAQTNWRYAAKYRISRAAASENEAPAIEPFPGYTPLLGEYTP